MQSWRTRGKVTTQAFSRALNQSHYEALFAFFDKECKARKPRNMQLKRRYTRKQLMGLSTSKHD